MVLHSSNWSNPCEGIYFCEVGIESIHCEEVQIIEGTIFTKKQPTLGFLIGGDSTLIVEGDCTIEELVNRLLGESEGYSGLVNITSPYNFVKQGKGEIHLYV